MIHTESHADWLDLLRTVPDLGTPLVLDLNGSRSYISQGQMRVAYAMA